MAVRIFISHSTGEKSGHEVIAGHAEFRQKVYSRLKDQEGFDIQIDNDIPTGTYWRELLFGRLDECNAAIVLVNERALLHSDWVDFEVKILGWRAWIERKNFRLIMIPFGGVTRDQIVRHQAWEALALGEIQMIPSAEAGLDISDNAAVDKTLNEIVAALSSLSAQNIDKSVYGWIVGNLASFLNLERKALEHIANELGLPVLNSLDILKQQIARRLYDEGPKALRILLEVYDAKIPNEDLQTVLEILSTSWVDPGASVTILKFCRSATPKRVFAINGKIQYFTPEVYIRQICCWRKPWPVITVDEKQGQKDILEQIRAELKRLFKKNLRKSHTTKDKLDLRLNELLNSRLKQLEAPVFVALSPVAARDDTLIKAICDTYNDLRVILCTGGGEPLPGIEMLMPELDLQLETDVWTVYDATLSLLT